VLFYVFLCCSMYCLFCVVLCIVCFVSFSVLFVCICVLNYCHRVATQLQLNISYKIKPYCFRQRTTAAKPVLLQTHTQMYNTVHHFLAVFVNIAPVEYYQVMFCRRKLYLILYSLKSSPNSGFEEDCTFLYSISGRSSVAHPALYSMNTGGSVTRTKAERRKVESLLPSRN
jgi:hypothetical protein